MFLGIITYLKRISGDAYLGTYSSNLLNTKWYGTEKVVVLMDIGLTVSVSYWKTSERIYLISGCLHFV